MPMEIQGKFYFFIQGSYNAQLYLSNMFFLIFERTTNLHEAIREALDYLDVNSLINFSDFDEDGDGKIDAITIFHSGCQRTSMEQTTSIVSGVTNGTFSPTVTVVKLVLGKAKMVSRFGNIIFLLHSGAYKETTLLALV